MPTTWTPPPRIPPDAAAWSPVLSLGSALDRYLFENPWPLIGALVLGAGVAFTLLNRRGRVGAAIACVALALLVSLGAWLAARGVTTDRERVRDLTVSLVNAAARVDESALLTMLADDLTLYLKVGAISGDTSMDRAMTIQQARRSLGGLYKLREWRVSGNDVVATGTHATATLSITVVAEVYAIPHRSEWRVDWRREADGTWRAFAIELLSMPGIREP
ncbi:MAG: hypothetical protein JNL50_10305 [Phycisphaerae bacterium]|nr:hypothetical protein [Phycisphaerae bacterium]